MAAARGPTAATQTSAALTRALEWVKAPIDIDSEVRKTQAKLDNQLASCREAVDATQACLSLNERGGRATIGGLKGHTSPETLLSSFNHSRELIQGAIDIQNTVQDLLLQTKTADLSEPFQRSIAMLNEIAADLGAITTFVDNHREDLQIPEAPSRAAYALDRTKDIAVRALSGIKNQTGETLLAMGGLYVGIKVTTLVISPYIVYGALAIAAFGRGHKFS